jgi:multidrug efflux pump subunit AcrA (membrane-fusion protein)
MSPNVDLSQLAVRRDGASSTPRTRRSWHAGTRIVLPGLVLLGFVAVVGWAARDRLLPATPVTVISVVTTHLDVQSEGTPIFQAAGWIEPRPTPILVTALTEGVVEKLLVVEGQTIQAGEPVAHLIQDDARLALQTADADLELRQAEVDNVKATLTLAKAMLPLQLKAARSRLALAKESLDARTRAAELGASPLLALPLARSEVEVAASAVAELELKENGIKAEGLRPFAELEANVKAASTRAKLAEIAVAAARLRLDRTVIKAPVAGQVMTLIARPGQRLMGQSPAL